MLWLILFEVFLQGMAQNPVVAIFRWMGFNFAMGSGLPATDILTLCTAVRRTLPS